MISDIEHFASLHDVGKIAIRRILRKQGPLTPQEFSEMKLHTTKGYMIIQGLALGPVWKILFTSITKNGTAAAIPRGCAARIFR